MRREISLARFWERVEESDGHWMWRGSLKANGYGQFTPDGFHYAHRWAYANFTGPIPDCHVRACVNPGHLEAVTLAENRRRRDARRTHCKHGHAYNDGNTYRWTDPQGYVSRACRTCRSQASRDRRAVA